MPSYSKIPLSASVNGRGVKVGSIAIASGTTIHTAQSGALLDLVTLFVTNTDSVARSLTVGWGGVADPDDLIYQTISARSGLVLVVADLPLTNSLIVKAASDSVDKLIFHGYVNRVS